MIQASLAAPNLHDARVSRLAKKRTLASALVRKAERLRRLLPAERIVSPPKKENVFLLPFNPAV